MIKRMCLIYSTFPAIDDAKRVGKILVEERLAACVNIIPKIHSIYWWDDKIEEDSEVVLIAKTTTRTANRIVETIKTHHPYELPAILIVPVEGGFEGFLDYVESEVK